MIRSVNKLLHFCLLHEYLHKKGKGVISQFRIVAIKCITLRKNCKYLGKTIYYLLLLPPSVVEGRNLRTKGIAIACIASNSRSNYSEEK